MLYRLEFKAWRRADFEKRSLDRHPQSAVAFIRLYAGWKLPAGAGGVTLGPTDLDVALEVSKMFRAFVDVDDSGVLWLRDEGGEQVLTSAAWEAIKRAFGTPEKGLRAIMVGDDAEDLADVLAFIKRTDATKHEPEPAPAPVEAVEAAEGES